MNRLDKKIFYQFPKYGFENILHENHFHPNQLTAFKPMANQDYIWILQDTKKSEYKILDWSPLEKKLVSQCSQPWRWRWSWRRLILCHDPAHTKRLHVGSTCSWSGRVRKKKDPREALFIIAINEGNASKLIMLKGYLYFWKSIYNLSSKISYPSWIPQQAREKSSLCKDVCKCQLRLIRSEKKTLLAVVSKKKDYWFSKMEIMITESFWLICFSSQKLFKVNDYEQFVIILIFTSFCMAQTLK